MTDTTFTSSYVLTDAILEAHIGADPRAEAIALKALAAASQAWYCQRATKAIDALPLGGYKYLSTQALAFPRKYEYQNQPSPWGAEIITDFNGYVLESVDVPQCIIDACCEETIALYSIYNTPDKLQRLQLQREGAVSVNYGGTSEQYASNPGGSVSSVANRYAGLMSKEAYDLVAKYIDPSAPIL